MSTWYLASGTVTSTLPLEAVAVTSSGSVSPTGTLPDWAVATTDPPMPDSWTLPDCADALTSPATSRTVTSPDSASTFTLATPASSTLPESTCPLTLVPRGTV